MPIWHFQRSDWLWMAAGVSTVAAIVASTVYLKMQLDRITFERAETVAARAAVLRQEIERQLRHDLEAQREATAELKAQVETATTAAEEAAMTAKEAQKSKLIVPKVMLQVPTPLRVATPCPPCPTPEPTPYPRHLSVMQCIFGE